MSNSDWFDDFMDIKLSGSADDSEGKGRHPQNGGCLPVVIGVLALGAVLSFLGGT